MKIFNLAFLIVAVFFYSCDKNNDDDNQIGDDLISVGQVDTQLGQFKVGLYSSDSLFEGYNILYIDLQNSLGMQITNASIDLLPVMNMVAKKHAGPVENPDELCNDKGYFEGAVVFIMPSNPDEGWTLDVAVDVAGIKDTAHFILPMVKSLNEPKLLKVISPIDSKRYFISILKPSSPIVGINDIEFTVHYMQNMMSFPAVDDLTIAIEPEMPSMNHGSPNNVNPVYIGEGHYLGKVNFTMTGWWRVNLSINQGSNLVSDDAYFDITF